MGAHMAAVASQEAYLTCITCTSDGLETGSAIFLDTTKITDKDHAATPNIHCIIVWYTSTKTTTVDVLSCMFYI